MTTEDMHRDILAMLILGRRAQNAPHLQGVILVPIWGANDKEWGPIVLACCMHISFTFIKYLVQYEEHSIQVLFGIGCFCYNFNNMT